MTSETFVDKLMNVVVDRNHEADKLLLSDTPLDSVTDTYWKNLLILYRSLDENGRGTIIQLMNQVRVDTLSECLGIIDGVCTLDTSIESMILIVNPEGLQINGSLQEMFLAAEDVRSRKD